MQIPSLDGRSQELCHGNQPDPSLAAFTPSPISRCGRLLHVLGCTCRFYGRFLDTPPPPPQASSFTANQLAMSRGSETISLVRSAEVPEALVTASVQGQEGEEVRSRAFAEYAIRKSPAWFAQRETEFGGWCLLRRHHWDLELGLCGS